MVEASTEGAQNVAAIQLGNGQEIERSSEKSNPRGAANRMAATFCAPSVLASTITYLCFFLWLSSRSAYFVSGRVGTFGGSFFAACVSFASRPFTIPLRSIPCVAGERFLRCLSFSSVSCPHRSTFLQLPIDPLQSPVMMPSVCMRLAAPITHARTRSHSSPSRSSSPLHRLRYRFRYFSNAGSHPS